MGLSRYDAAPGWRGSAADHLDGSHQTSQVLCPYLPCVPFGKVGFFWFSLRRFSQIGIGSLRSVRAATNLPFRSRKDNCRGSGSSEFFLPGELNMVRTAFGVVNS